LGPLLYRAGRFAEAVQQSRQAIQIHGQDGLVPDRLFLAMALHRLGQTDKARKWLDKAVEQIDRQKQNQFSEDATATPLAWPVRLENQLLRREAEACLREPHGTAAILHHLHGSWEWRLLTGWPRP
jgi:hypothetical protein